MPAPLINRMLEHFPRWHDAGMHRSWWEEGAHRAFLTGHYDIIPSHSKPGLDYLARFWLSTPVLGIDKRWESCDSALLHCFLMADDDVLHDHPWGFSTTILSGWYIEDRPVRWSHQSLLGPTERLRTRHDAGATIHRNAEDLHAITAVAPKTWTFVRTGSREREWGFHAPGQEWSHWKTHLNF